MFSTVACPHHHLLQYCKGQVYIEYCIGAVQQCSRCGYMIRVITVEPLTLDVYLDTEKWQQLVQRYRENDNRPLDNHYPLEQVQQERSQLKGPSYWVRSLLKQVDDTTTPRIVPDDEIVTPAMWKVWFAEQGLVLSNEDKE